MGRARQLARLPSVRVQHVLARYELQEVRVLALLHADRSGRDQVSDKIDESPYVSDKSSYDSALEGIRSGKTNKFIQIITMQNHMPYHEWYENNDYTAESTTGTPLGDDEQQSIETYQKGVEITDQATQEFLNELDALDKPVTVVFYGDHLPGIYSSAQRGWQQLLGPAPDRLLHLVE